MQGKINIALIIILVVAALVLLLGNRAHAPVADDGLIAPEIARIGEIAQQVTVAEPLPGSLVASPLQITGMAPGNWFFEGDAPVVLTDWDGLIIAQSYITAQGEWMTTDLVPFAGTITFEVPNYGDTGSLILQRDNPSDLPENDAAVEFMIRFAPAGS